LNLAEAKLAQIKLKGWPLKGFGRGFGNAAIIRLALAQAMYLLRALAALLLVPGAVAANQAFDGGQPVTAEPVRLAFVGNNKLLAD